MVLVVEVMELSEKVLALAVMVVIVLFTIGVVVMVYILVLPGLEEDTVSRIGVCSGGSMEW